MNEKHARQSDHTIGRTMLGRKFVWPCQTHWWLWQPLRWQPTSQGYDPGPNASFQRHQQCALSLADGAPAALLHTWYDSRSKGCPETWPNLPCRLTKNGRSRYPGDMEKRPPGRGDDSGADCPGTSGQGWAIGPMGGHRASYCNQTCASCADLCHLTWVVGVDLSRTTRDRGRRLSEPCQVRRHHWRIAGGNPERSAKTLRLSANGGAAWAGSRAACSTSFACSLRAWKGAKMERESKKVTAVRRWVNERWGCTVQP